MRGKPGGDPSPRTGSHRSRVWLTHWSKRERWSLYRPDPGTKHGDQNVAIRPDRFGRNLTGPLAFAFVFGLLIVQPINTRSIRHQIDAIVFCGFSGTCASGVFSR